MPVAQVWSIMLVAAVRYGFEIMDLNHQLKLLATLVGVSKMSHHHLNGTETSCW